MKYELDLSTHARDKGGYVQIILTLSAITLVIFHPSPMDYAMGNVFTFIYLSSILSKSSNRV